MAQPAGGVCLPAACPVVLGCLGPMQGAWCTSAGFAAVMWWPWPPSRGRSRIAAPRTALSGAGDLVRLCRGFSPVNENFGCTVVLRSTEIASGVASNSKFRLRCWRRDGGVPWPRVGAAGCPPPHKSLSGPSPTHGRPPVRRAVCPCRADPFRARVVSVSCLFRVGVRPFLVCVSCCVCVSVWLSSAAVSCTLRCFCIV